jgi:Pyridoxamine 5'-phosphate oxidase
VNAQPSVALRQIAACFEGAIPSAICTCSADGISNVTYAPIVHLIDERRIAISNQYLDKAHRNLESNPRARIIVVDPSSLEQYRIDAAHERSEAAGPLLESKGVRLDAIAPQASAGHRGRLHGVDVFSVLECARLRPSIAGQLEGDANRLLRGLRAVSSLAAICTDLESLMTRMLAAFEDELGDDGAAATAKRNELVNEPMPIKHYQADDSIFFGGDYVIKGVAGRILWRLLQQYTREGCRDFSNRQLRLDPELKLPTLRDNLEARLILLRRRLAEQCDFLAIVPTTRGRFRLDVSRPVTLEDIDVGT